MPTIQDVADQVNAKIDQIQANTAGTVAVGNGIRTDLSTIGTKLDILDADLKTGVTELSSGLFAIWELHKVTNAILNHNNRQNDTIICLLENNNELLCGMTRKLTTQLALSEQLVKSVKRIEGITERIQPAAAGDYDRLEALHQELLACCPPEEVPPEPCPEPCGRPALESYKPEGQGWRPSRRPQTKD